MTEALWGEVRPELERIVDELPEATWSQVDWFENDSFPLRVSVALMAVRDPAGDEDVVFSADFFRDGDRCRFSCDIAAGDGQILADGPGSTYPSRELDLPWARDCLTGFVAFLTDHLFLARTRLAAAARERRTGTS